jgi:hypothetical protein
VSGHDRSHRTGTTRAERRGDVPVGHHSTGWNRTNHFEHVLHELGSFTPTCAELCEWRFVVVRGMNGPSRHATTLGPKPHATLRGQHVTVATVTGNFAFRRGADIAFDVPVQV